MKPVIIIPARYASTRFPGKPLVEINGKSMIMHVVNRAESFCKDVYVATDDKGIFEHVTSYGSRAIMTKASHQSGTDRISEAFGKIKNNKIFDVVVNLQGDEPFIDPKQISELIAVFKKPEVQIGTLARSMKDKKDIADPNKVKVVFDKNGEALYFSRAEIPFIRDAAHAMHYKHVGIYAFRPDVLKKICKLPQCDAELTEKLEQLRWLWNGYPIHVAVTKYENVSVDTPGDLESLLKK
jgi:3-deoxy-manno-octulosonate cytidylyltransferase (CMP-KDO synthetase)